MMTTREQSDNLEDKKQKFITTLKGGSSARGKFRVVARPLVTKRFDRKKVARTIEQLEHMCK